MSCEASEPRKYSEEWVKKTVAENGYGALLHHDCALCGVRVAYFFDAGGVTFNSSCGCGSAAPSRSSFRAVADWLEMQSSDEIREKLIGGFR